jgi:hypothetical protein
MVFSSSLNGLLWPSAEKKGGIQKQTGFRYGQEKKGKRK